MFTTHVGSLWGALELKKPLRQTLRFREVPAPQPQFSHAAEQWHQNGQISKQQNISSSTAQGGGGSFKNRITIGEVGCCESRMAERIH